tara:strand:+ start:25303 stop:25464 length:162 start_codon:yes stop_codon:yes gene_type:complete
MGCADFDDPNLSLIPGLRKDIMNPKEAADIIAHLPEVATFLNNYLTDNTIHES